MSRRYEATAPITLPAAATVASGLKNKLCHINSSGQAVLLTAAAASANVPVVGTFAQDGTTQGMAVTINQLQGKVTMVAGAAIAAGEVVTANASTTTSHAGTVVKSDNSDDTKLSATRMNVGVALEAAAALNDDVQVLAIPFGVGVG